VACHSTWYEVLMPRVITSIDAQIDPGREHLSARCCCAGKGGAWRIETTWRDFDALMAVRSNSRKPDHAWVNAKVGGVIVAHSQPHG